MTEVLPNPQTINLITWNILLDKSKKRKGLIRPQAERVDQFVATLDNFDGSLDVVGMQEVEGGNGHTIASRLGYDTSFWFRHNDPEGQRPGRGRKLEHVGAFGALVDNAKPIDIGDHRVAVVIKVGAVAIVVFHLRSGRNDEENRYEQICPVLDEVKDEKHVALIGDLNAHPFEKARKAIKNEGFSSAHRRFLRTYPTPDYAAIMAGDDPYRRFFFEHAGLPLDTISVRGLHVVASGILEERGQPSEPDALASRGASDHFALYATVQTA